MELSIFMKKVLRSFTLTCNCLFFGWFQAKFYGMTGLSGNVIILTVLYYGGSLVTDDLISVG